MKDGTSPIRCVEMRARRGFRWMSSAAIPGAGPLPVGRDKFLLPAARRLFNCRLKFDCTSSAASHAKQLPGICHRLNASAGRLTLGCLSPNAYYSSMSATPRPRLLRPLAQQYASWESISSRSIASPIILQRR